MIPVRQTLGPNTSLSPVVKNTHYLIDGINISGSEDSKIKKSESIESQKRQSYVAPCLGACWARVKAASQEKKGGGVASSRAQGRLSMSIKLSLLLYKVLQRFRRKIWREI